MGGDRYQINLNEIPLTIGLKKGPENRYKFYVGYITFEFNDFDNIIRIIEELGKINNIKEKEKHISLNEYVQFYRTFISDTSTLYNYEFRIYGEDKQRNEGYSVYIHGIEQLNLVKDSLIKLHNQYLNDEWLDEKVRAEGPKFVEYDGKKIEVEKKYGRLLLDNRGIKRITDVKGLKDIKYLKILNLQDNEIEEIEGLDHLVYLRTLSLSKNYIKEIKDLDKLENLEELYLSNNPLSSLEGLEQLKNLRRLSLDGTLIPKEVFKEAGIEDPSKAVGIIKYIKQKKEEIGKREQCRIKTIEYIKQASSVFEEITFSKIVDRTGIELHDLEEIVEDLIFSGKINAKIRKDGIVFIEENPLIEISLEAVDVLRGIKDDTELISQYTSYIEEVFDKTENLEEYLKTHLAGEFEKIKNAWQDYKEGKIDKRELIKTGIKEIGKKFVKIFVKKL